LACHQIGLLCERHNETTSHIAVVLSLVSTACLYLYDLTKFTFG